MWRCPSCETINEHETCLICGENKPINVPDYSGEYRERVIEDVKAFESPKKVTPAKVPHFAPPTTMGERPIFVDEDHMDKRRTGFFSRFRKKTPAETKVKLFSDIDKYDEELERMKKEEKRKKKTGFFRF